MIKKILKWTFILALVGIIINLFLTRNGREDTSQTADVPQTRPLFDTYRYEQWNQELANTPSDIEGLSLLDKQRMGLAPYEGSDSDADGLTDKEEIEVYGTDPLKASTAEDFISDGYRVAHDLSLTEHYDVADFEDITLEYLYQFPGEIVATPNVLDDYYGRILNMTGEFDDSLDADTKWKIYNTYIIQNFSGQIGISLAEAGCSAKEKDLVLLMSNGLDLNEATVVGSKVEDGVIYVTDETPDSYCLVLAEEKSFLEKTFGVSESRGITPDDDSFTLENIPAVVTYSRCLEYYLVRPGHIYYVSSGDAEKDKNYLENLCKGLNSFHAYSMTDPVTPETCQSVSKTKYNLIKFLCEAFIDNRVCPLSFMGGALQVTDNLYTDKCYYSLYFTSDDITVNVSADHFLSDGESDTSGVRNHPVFNNFFPFQNFGSYIAPGGNCAGIAYYTADVYNMGFIKYEGDIKFHRSDGKILEFSYDISQFEENDTLFDRGLADFRSATFVDDNLNEDGDIDYPNLSPADQSFVDMIGTYWAYFNAIPETNVAGNGDVGTIAVTYETLLNAMDALDHKEMLIFAGTMYSQKCLINEYGEYDSDTAIANHYTYGGHVVNLIGYKMDDSGEFCKTIFYVWDSNYPNEIGKLIYYSVDRNPRSIVDWCYIDGGNLVATSFAHDKDGKNEGAIFTSELECLNKYVRVVPSAS